MDDLAALVPVLLWTTDARGEITFFNEAWTRLTGRRPVHPLTEHALEAVHPDDRPGLTATWERALAARGPLDTEYRLRTADGSYRWVLDRGRPAFAPDGTFLGHAGATVDIHERVHAEEETRLLADAGALLADAREPEHALAAAAARCCPVVGDRCAVVLDADAAPRAAAIVPALAPDLAAAVGGARGPAVVAPLVARGSAFGVLVAASRPPRRPGDRELRVAQAVADRIAAALDGARLLDAARAAGRASDAARGVLDAFVAAAPAGLAFFDPELRYLQVNDVLAAANGVPAGEHLGRRPSEVLGPFGHGVEEVLRRALATEVPVLDLEFTGPPGEAGGERHWVAGFYPVRGGDGEVAGVGVVATDVTARVEAERARARLLAHSRFLAEAADALDAALDFERTLEAVAALATRGLAAWAVVAVDAPGGGHEAVVAGHRDPARRALAQELAAPRPPFEGPGGPPGSVRAGEPVLYAEVTPALLAGLGHGQGERAALARLGCASAIVAPLAARGETLGTITLVADERHYDEDDVALARELGRRAGLALDNARLYRRALEGRRAAAASQAVLDAYIERAPVGFALLDAELRCRRVNARLAEIAGRPAERQLGRTVDELLPGLPPAFGAVLAEVLATGQPRTDLPVATDAGGGRRHFLVSAYRVRLGEGPASGVACTVVDVTDRHDAEEALRSQRDLYETLLRAQSDMGEAFVLVEGSRILYVNAAAERIAERSAQELYDLRSFLHLFPAWAHDELRDHVRRIRERRDAEVGLETELLLPAGGGVPIELAAQPLEVDGRTRFVVVARDISERRRQEREREELLDAEQRARHGIAAAHARTRLLAELSEVMEASMDLRVTLREAARVLARETADAVDIDVLTPDGASAERLGRAARDAARDARAVALAGTTYPVTPGHPAGAALLRGEAQLHPRLAHPAPERADAVAGDAMLVLPLAPRGRVIGALTCTWDRAEALPSGPALAHLEEVARRLALTIDNALLYAERAHIASTLQAGLLPPVLPAIPGVASAARYLPAGEAVQVGGDFYDLFRAGDEWAIVVGDVCGKGAEAAAVTAMARYTLRAASLAGPASPAAALGLLNTAMRAERVPERFLTAVLGHLRPHPHGGATLTLVAAGHPAPLVARADGTIEAVRVRGPLLGILDGATWSETTVQLAPGDGVVLYTDGVTEADRTRPLQAAGLAALLAAGAAPRGAAALAEAVRRVAEERAAGRLRDDVAIVALCLDPA